MNFCGFVSLHCVDLQQPEEARAGNALQSGEASEEVSDDQRQLYKDGVKSTLGRGSCKCKGPGVGLVCLCPGQLSCGVTWFFGQRENSVLGPLLTFFPLPSVLLWPANFYTSRRGPTQCL